ncbi:hypothetical protein M513_09580, partial [Trichuris suis]
MNTLDNPNAARQLLPTAQAIGFNGMHGLAVVPSVSQPTGQSASWYVVAVGVQQINLSFASDKRHKESGSHVDVTPGVHCLKPAGHWAKLTTSLTQQIFKVVGAWSTGHRSSATFNYSSVLETVAWWAVSRQGSRLDAAYIYTRMASSFQANGIQRTCLLRWYAQDWLLLDGSKACRANILRHRSCASRLTTQEWYVGLHSLTIPSSSVYPKGQVADGCVGTVRQHRCVYYGTSAGGDFSSRFCEKAIKPLQGIAAVPNEGWGRCSPESRLSVRAFEHSHHHAGDT